MLKTYTQKTTSSEGVTAESFSVDDPTVDALDEVIELVVMAIDEVRNGKDSDEAMFDLKTSIVELWSSAVDKARSN